MFTGVPDCTTIETSCGDCIQNVDPPCSWCEDAVCELTCLVLTVNYLNVRIFPTSLDVL